MSDPAPKRPSLLAEARTGVRGVFGLLAFRPDWRIWFNPTQAGLVRSFAGVILAFPAFWFMVSAAAFFAAENPGTGTPADPAGAAQIALTWARLWLLFPLVAFGVCVLLGLRDRLTAWVVVHNWTVFVLIHVQALFWALYMAGLADPQSLGALLAVYQIVRLAVHWRVAHGALGLSPGPAAAAAGVVLLTDLLVARTLF